MSRVIAVMFNKSCGQIINVGSDFRNYYAYILKRGAEIIFFTTNNKKK